MVTFNINLFSIKKSYFLLLSLSSVTMATSLSGGTQDFLKLSFHMFPYNEILKVFKVKSDLIFEESTSKYPQTQNFSEISKGVWKLRASETYVSVNSNWVHPPRATPGKIFLSE